MTSDFIQTVPIGSREKLIVRGVAAVPGHENSVIRLRLSSPVDTDIARQYLEVKPQVDYRVSAVHNELTLTGKFQPGATYQLILAQGLPATDDSVLAGRYSHTLRIDDLKPYVDFKNEGEFLSASGYRTVAIESTNVDRVELSIDRVYLNNLFALFRFESYTYRYRTSYGYNISSGLGDQIASETLRLSGNRNELITRTIHLDQHIKDEQPGLYRISLFRPNSYRGTHRWLLITDLGIVAKKSGNEFLVWVSSFSNLGPIAQARVDLISDQQQTIASGRTNADGLWRAGNLDEMLKKHRPYMVTVKRGKDYSFLLLDRHAISTSGFDVAGSLVPETGYQAFLYGERDIYRPGETLKGLAILRDRRLRSPPSMPVLIRHRDPQGRERSVQKLQTDRHGLTEFTLEIPAYIGTGNHKLELVVAEDVVGNYQFQVEEFVPDRIKVELSTEKTEYGFDEEIRCEVIGTYLFGAPAARLSVESRVWLRPTIFAPREHSEFVFQNPSRKLDVREVFTEQEHLDDAGKRAFSVNLPPGLKVPSSLEALITARVQEQGGRGVTALKRVTVHPYPHYVGLRRLEDSYAEPGQKAHFEYLVLDPQGRPAASGNLRVEFFRDRWHTVLRRTASGNYRYESTPEAILIDTRNLAVGNDRGSFSFTPPEYGSYRVVVTEADTGASSQVDFYASGWGYSPWAIKNPARLELDLDKDQYRLGGTAALQVRAPFPGKVWLTVERDQVYYSRVFSLSGNTAKITIPIRSEYRPNAYITATLVRSAGDLPAGQPGRAFGAVPLYVDLSGNRLPVEIAVSDEIRPRSTLVAEVATRPGARVTMAVVDEGVLQLIAQKTSDPFSFFYRKLALGVESYDIFTLLMPETQPMEGQSAAGGGMPRDLSQFVRTEGIRRTKPVAFWSGVLSADSSGKAVASFDVPEFQGALRIMAVAHLNDRFGSAEHFTRVRDPLLLLPTFPRFLSFEENVEIPVTVRNDTGRMGNFKVSLSVEGPVSLQGESSQTVEVPNNSERTIYFSLKSGDQSGDVKLELEASGNAERTTTSSTFPLRADLPARTIEQAGSIAESSTSWRPTTPQLFAPDL